MEINLRLDGEGRTKGDDDVVAQEKGLDYRCKSTMTSLVPSFDIDDLCFDCEIADCGLMPRTFWMSPSSKPRFSLEQMALDVFHHHVPAGYKYDPATSGAEWWIQLRPSPPGLGRYAMHDSASNTNKEEDMSKAGGISFHWDKDEDLRILAGGDLHVHPHISTVTYLTSIGAPTMVFHRRIHNVTGQWIEHCCDDNDDEAYISWPNQGKHLSFDGRYLHAAPVDLMRPGAFQNQIQVPAKQTTPQQQKVLIRRHRRCTFLVNVWLNYHPYNVEPFPETMIDKMSKCSSGTHLFPVAEKEPMSSVTLEIKEKEDATQTFTWPMGGCGSTETITAKIPIRKVRDEANNGGNIQLKWSSGGVVLSKGAQAEAGSKESDRNKRQLEDDCKAIGVDKAKKTCSKPDDDEAKLIP